MKNKNLKRMVVAVSWLSALAAPVMASAHESGVRSLGYGAAATDFYQVSCYDDGNGPADYLEVQLLDLAPKPTPDPVISIQVIKGIKASNATDLGDGDAKPSPALRLHGGNGTYLVTVNKTRMGKETYQFSYHCVTDALHGNAHTGTSEPLPVAQNQ